MILSHPRGKAVRCIVAVGLVISLVSASMGTALPAARTGYTAPSDLLRAPAHASSGVSAPARAVFDLTPPRSYSVLSGRGTARGSAQTDQGTPPRSSLQALALDQAAAATRTATALPALTTAERPPTADTSSPLMASATQPVRTMPGTHWYFAAQPLLVHLSGQDVRSQEAVAILNPNAVPAPVTLSYYARGPGQQGTLRHISHTIPAHTMWMEDITALLQHSAESAIMVESPQVISVQRIVQRRTGVGQQLAPNITPGVMAPQEHWLFPEGYAGLTYGEYLTLFNPSVAAAHVTVRFAAGSSRGPSIAPLTLTVAASGQATVDVGTLARRAHVAAVGLLVDATQPIVAQRTLYWGAGATARQFGSDARPGLTQASTTWYFTGASTYGGDQPFLLLVAPSAAAAVTVTVSDQQGHALHTLRASVAHGRRVTLRLDTILPRTQAPLQITVQASQPVGAEIAQYGGGSPNHNQHAGDVIAGLPTSLAYAHLPYLNTAAGAHAGILTLYNPETRPLTVTITAYTATGAHGSRTLTVAPGRTVQVDVATLGLPAGTLGVTLAATSGRFVAYAQGVAGTATEFLSEAAIPLPVLALRLVLATEPSLSPSATATAQPPQIPSATAPAMVVPTTLHVEQPSATATATSIVPVFIPAAPATAASSPPVVSATAVPLLPTSSPLSTRAPAQLTLTLSGPGDVSPGATVPYTVQVTNTGAVSATTATVFLTFPDGGTGLIDLGPLAGGAMVTRTLTWTVPTLPAKSGGEAESAYLSRLTSVDGTALTAVARLSWGDAQSGTGGSATGQTTVTERVPVLQYTAVAGPDTLVPGTVVTTTVSVRNTGSGDASSVMARVTNPDRSISGAQGGSLAGGAATTLQVSWLVPTMPHATTESDGAYAARLAAQDTHTRPFMVGLDWQDGRLNSYGEIGADRAATERVPIVAIGLDGPQTPTPGTTVTYTVSLTNTGSVAAALLNLSVVMPDRSLRVPDAGGALGSGESRQVTIPYSVPLTLPAGAFVAHARVTWQDSAQNAYGPRAAVASTIIADEPALHIGLDGPAMATAGDTITYTVTLTNTAISGSAEADAARVTLIFPDRSRRTLGAGDPIASGASRSIPVSFTIPATQTAGEAPALAAVTWQDDAGNTLGPRVASTMVTLAAAPTATATAIPTDTPTSTSTPSPAASPTPGVVSAAIERITGSFFPNPSNSGAFNTSPSAQPAFSEQFPVIDFNPPGGASTFCADSTGVNEGTRPFADVVPKPDGTCAAQIAQSADGSSQAGVGDLGAFQAVFTSTLVVTGTGYATFNFFSDDGWVFSLGPSANGDQPSYYSGAFANPPPSGPFTGYKVVGSYNTNSSPTVNNVTVYFSHGGRYPVEFDYTECCGGQLSFTVDLNAQSIPSAPTDTPTSLPTNTPTVGPTNTAGPSATSTSSIESPGWIGSPSNGAQVSGLVPIVLAPGETLQAGTVDYYPADDPSSVTTLATIIAARVNMVAMAGRHAGLAAPPRAATGSAIATLDTTTLEDGSYIIRVRGTDTNGHNLTSEVYISVVGDLKPGRVTFTQTDLTVPVAGLPIVIGRTYDSLNRSRSGDFGYGWALSQFNAHLQVDPAMNVTLDLPNGKRSTFFFTPQGHILYETPSYVAGPGVYGSLSADGCFLFEPSSNGYYCMFGDGPNGLYQPSTYTYTDPYGRVYVYGADGGLRSVRDLSGTTLTSGPNGIVSSAGNQVVSFARDGQGRITSITDPDGHVYRYSYDGNGDLSSVSLPGVATPLTYTYDSKHLLMSATDARGNHGALTTYYPDGRLQSLTDALGNTTSYSYSVGANTTYVTNPDGGVITSTADSNGNLVSQTDPLGHTSAYTYDGSNNRTSQTDPQGHTTTYTYDGAGHPTSVTDPLGHTIHVTYGGYGGPSMIVDQMGHTQTIQYGLAGNNSIAAGVRDSMNAPVRAMDQGISNVPGDYLPSSVQDSLGTLGRMTYDLQGNVQTQTDANGKVTSYTYDAYGNRTSETDPLGRTIASTYDDLGRQISSTDALARTTGYGYDGQGRLLTTTDPLGQVTRYEYDANGNRTAEINPAGRRTTYTYDAADQLITTTSSDGAATGATYDYRGNPLTRTDQAGRVTRNQYDQAGNLMSVTVAAGTADAGVTSYGYDAAGRKTSETDALGNTTGYTYDAAGHLTMVTDPLGHTTTYTYDADGLTASHTDAKGHQTGYAYDVRGRLIKTAYTDGTTTLQSYDGVGNVLSSADQVGRTMAYSYDAAGELLATTDPLSNTTAYSYDAVGNIVTVTDANGHQTGSSYDALDRLSTQTWPDGSSESYGYDAAGNQSSHQLADGQTNRYSYDALGRLSGAAYFDGQRVDYTYTSAGQQETVTDGRGVTRYTYDNQDRPTGITQPTGQSIAYSYDAAGNRLSLTTPAGTTTYGYDALNRLAAVTDPSHGTTTYGYDPVGNRTGLTLPNGVMTDYTYNALDRLTGIVQHKAGQSALTSYAYTLDANGNRLGVVEGDGSSIGWGYDRAGRLTGETRYGSNGAVTSRLSYSYDNVGNRLSMAANGQTTDYSYNASDQVGTAGSTRYSYDRRGNLVGVADAGSATSYRYDAANRFAGATTPNGTTASYRYDAAGRRVNATTGGATTGYLWDEASAYGDVALETAGSGVSQASYTLGEGELLSQKRGESTSYYLRDGQNSTRALTDGSGSVTDRYSYDAFGTLQDHQGSTANPYLYTGQQYDATTGLYNLRARDYNPADGRFLTRDTAGFDQSSPTNLNRYLYAASDPINGLDPSGYDTAEYARIISIAAIVGRAAGLFLARAIVQGVAWNLACGLISRVGGTNAETACNILSVVGNPKQTLKLLPNVYRGGADLLRGGGRDLVNTARQTVKDLLGGCSCFPAGIQVSTPTGDTSIQSLHIGDTVLSENTDTGKVEAEQVQAIIHRPVSSLMAVNLSDGSAITVTVDHPFWIDSGVQLTGAGWLPAGQLQAGDRLRTASGTDVTVTGVRRNVGRAVVYTLTVARDHTFFVGSARVLVHNCPRGAGGRSGGIKQKVFTGDSAALIALAKQAQRTGVSRQEADTLLQWARELGVPALDHTAPQDAAHYVGGPHIRIGPVNHIPVHP